MKALVNLIDTLIQKLLIVLMALLFIDVTWQVLSRFILAQPSSFTEELARFLLIWIGLLGAAQVYRHKMHLGVDILVAKASPKGQQLINKIVHLITALFAASVLIYGGVKLMLLAIHLNQYSPAMQVNMGLVYFALPLSGAIFVLFAVDEIISAKQNAGPNDSAVNHQESL